MRRLCLLLALCLPAALTGCSGELLDEVPSFCPPANPARFCYSNADCAPAGCCGTSSCAVHVDDAPSCQDVRCDGTCDPSTTDCGCGLPVCRDGACTVAHAVEDGC